MSDPKHLEKNQVLKVEDANISDERIPRNLILMYGDQPYIQKAGLEWKANSLFGGAGYSVRIEMVSMDYEKRIFIAKAILTIAANGQVFENYGEATDKNTNTMMQKNLLHMAVTRAECRVLRMATACGYASYDEVMTLPNVNVAQTSVDPERDSKPATEAQIENIKNIVRYSHLEADDKDFWDEQFKTMTFAQAAAKTREVMELISKKGKK